MVNVSKRKLKPNIRDTITQQLVRHLAQANGEKSAKSFLAELLTEAEQVQLAKRLAVIILLLRGYSFTQIEKLIQVSPTTVVKLWKQFKDGKYKALVGRDTIHGRAFREDSVLESLLKLITDGLPPRAGRGRWKFLKGQ